MSTRQTEPHCQRRGIALILPLREADYGFDWGTDREHAILREPVTADDVAAITGWPREEDGCPCGLDDVDWDDMDSIAATIRETLELPPDDIRVVDDCATPTDDWPSAGCGESWGDDVWQGTADYLSYLAFGGRGEEYILAADDAASTVAFCGSKIVSDACDVIERRCGANDPIAVILRAAIAKAEGEKK